MTDNGSAYRGRAYAAAVADLEARHQRTRPFRPQTNGKAERFIKTLLAEWAYARPYADNADRLAALPEYLDFYNHQQIPHSTRRPHPDAGPRQQSPWESQLGRITEHHPKFASGPVGGRSASNVCCTIE